MKLVRIGGGALEVEVEGAGEPVLGVHGALIADSFRPMAAEPALAGRYRFIHYHRRGYVGSSPAPRPMSIAEQAADARALLGHLGIARAHVVGHSFGGSVALQLALDAPEVVHSLTLLEPAIVLGASARSYREAIARDAARHAAGDSAGAVEDFFRLRFGTGYRLFLDPVLPQAFAQSVADAGTTFEVDMPSLAEWRFAEAEARRISGPILSVLGAESDALWPRFGETYRQLRAWLPRADGYVLPEATHALQLQNPRGMAEALALFLDAHPL
jgi:pimeloyl-ACP methyl ester carboxylesterase